MIPLNLVNIYQYHLPLIQPIIWNDKSYSHRDGFLVCLKGGDKEGWGEIAPLPGFSRESFLEAKQEAIKFGKLLPNTPINAIDFRDVSLCPSVRFGFELAQLNLNTAVSNQSPDESQPVACCKLLSGWDHEQKALLDFRDRYRAVKIKVGRQSLIRDIEFVRMVCEENPRLEVRIDANRAWTLKEAREFLYNTRDLTLGYIEEPLRDKTGLLEFAHFSHIPLALDETLREPEAEQYKQVADVYVLKPTLSGGVSGTTKEIRQAQADSTRCIISSSYESGVGMLGLLGLARTIPDEIHGLDTYRALERDVLIKPLPLGNPILQLDKYFATESDLDFSTLEEVLTSQE